MGDVLLKSIGTWLATVTMAIVHDIICAKPLTLTTGTILAFPASRLLLPGIILLIAFRSTTSFD
jgi:hypothetical protein